MDDVQIVVIGSSSYQAPFIDHGTIIGASQVDYEEKKAQMADVMVFTGGTDINPAMYGEPPHLQTDPGSNDRDLTERRYLATAIKRGIPTVGICRGAQLQCIMAGGRLIQHVEGHNSFHTVLAPEYQQRVFEINSLHHQMMDISQISNCELLAYSEGVAKSMQDGYHTEILTYDDGYLIEPEVVWFPELKALGAQYHPEMMAYNKTAPGWVFFQSLLKRYIFI